MQIEAPSGRSATLVVLSELTTNQKGAIAETAVVHAAIKLGIDVYRPVAEGGRYEMIFEKDGAVLRVQCKWAGRYGDVVFVRCYSARRAPEGFRKRCCSATEVDAIAAYAPSVDRCFLIPPPLFEAKTHVQLRLAPARNNQRLLDHWADDYDFERLDWSALKGAIAQLGERRAGSAKVAGSSPAGSIAAAAPLEARPRGP